MLQPVKTKKCALFLTYERKDGEKHNSLECHAPKIFGAVFTVCGCNPRVFGG